MKKAEEINKVAQHIYDTELAKLAENRATQEKRYATLLTAAKEVCDHSEVLETVMTRRIIRDEEEYLSVACKICNKWLRNE